MRTTVVQLRAVDATPSSFSVHRPGNPYIPFGFRRLITSASCLCIAGTSMTSFGIVIGNAGSDFGLPLRNSTYSLMRVSLTSTPNGAVSMRRSR